MRFISRIWVFSLFLHLLFKQLQLWQNTYEDDFSKYKKRVNPDLLRTTMRGICHQAGEKLTYRQISADYQSSQIREALRLLTLAGIVTPVVATSGNGIPLDAEADEKSMKVLFLDPGLLLAVLQLEGDLSQQLIELILAGTPQELVSKGGITEMVAGLEMMRYKPCIQRQKMFSWEFRRIRLHWQSSRWRCKARYHTATLRIIPIKKHSGFAIGRRFYRVWATSVLQFLFIIMALRNKRMCKNPPMRDKNA